MKKALIFTLVFMLTVVNSSVAWAIDTSLQADISGGNAPFVLAKWEALPDRYSDENEAPGAQFRPSGEYQVNKTISICAIVSDPDGVADINNVYADVFWPKDIAVGPNHVKLPSQTGSSGAGCGLLMQEDALGVLTKTEGINLFCDQVYNQNNDLPTFGANYTYTDICKADGWLEKEKAKVYCVTKELSYEDPSGMYEVWAVAQDKNGKQGTLSNEFEYLAMTSFAADFGSVNYGSVRLNTEKIINGNLTFYTDDGLPTVRNVGNTRAQISVIQDDMKLGMTGSSYNVSYKARVGNDEADWATYSPNKQTPLLDELNLSETDEIDFGITVNKFPPNYSGPYNGTMTLTASSAPHLACAPKVGAKLSAYVTPTSCAFTVNVGESIQTALNSATTGQTVCVAAGTHGTPDTYPLMMNTAGVTLAGLGNAGDAVLGGGVSVNANDVTIKGLTIHNSNITGEIFGVYLNAGTTGATVSYNKLVGPGVATGSGLINVTNSGVAGLMFTNNESTNWLRGIFLNPSSNMTVEYNTLTGNGVGSANDNPSGNTIRRNQITNNSLEGVGAFLGATDSIAVTENNIYGNGGVANELNNYATNPVSAENNWWGDLTPADEIGGVGAAQVDFTPWATSAYALN